MAESSIQDLPLDQAKWHYSLHGKRFGPISEQDILNLLSKGTLNNDSLVWREGLDNWIPIGQTTLKQVVFVPPPLTGLSVNNAFVWFVAFAPIAGSILQYIIAGTIQTDVNNLWFITLVLNILFCLVDLRILINAGHNTATLGISIQAK